MKRLSLALITILALAGCGGGHHATPARSIAPQSATGSVHPPGWGSTPKGFVLPPQLPRAVPTATMWDAVTLSNVPAGPFAVAGYIAGSWPTWFQLAADFPRAHRVSIAIHLGEHAMCGDFEPGDMASSSAGAFALADIKAGFPTPCAYGDLSNMPAIKASLAATLGANWRAHVLLWLAWYTGRPGLVSGYDAVQFTDHALGRNLDENTVTLNFLRIAVPPYVPAPAYPVCFSHRIPAQTCAQAKAKVASRQRAAASSQRAFVARGCPVLTQRIGWFSSRLRSQPHTKVAYREGALAASRRVYGRQACGVFAQRAAWFTAAAGQLERSS